MKELLGVIHGRFQMLHKGHMEYLLAGKERCKHMVIGICNPDMDLTKFSSANPHRSQVISNPLTFYERFQMVQGSMLEAGVSLEEFDIVPFPINFPEKLFNYVPNNAKYYMTIYDQWSLEKKKILEDLGCNVEVMWQRTNDQKITSGSEVRSKIIKNQSWKDLVPQFVYEYTREHKIDVKIRQMAVREGITYD